MSEKIDQQWDFVFKLVSEAPQVAVNVVLSAVGILIMVGVSLWLFINWVLKTQIVSVQAQNATLEAHRKLAEDQAKIANAELSKTQQMVKELQEQIAAQADAGMLAIAASNVSLYVSKALSANNAVQASLRSEYPLRYPIVYAAPPSSPDKKK